MTGENMTVVSRRVLQCYNLIGIRAAECRIYSIKQMTGNEYKNTYQRKERDERKERREKETLEHIISYECSHYVAVFRPITPSM